MLVSQTSRSMPAALAIVVIASGFASASSASEDVSALLLRKTQAFSDAGQRGDAATMAKLLDERVVFFNEEGDGATKQELVESAGPGPAGMAITMQVGDWRCQVHGDFAVASFIDDQTVRSHGEITHARFRSVETWLKVAGDWRLLASQTLALADDPGSIRLPAVTLNEYAGSSRSLAGNQITFAIRGGELLASLNDGPATL